MGMTLVERVFLQPFCRYAVAAVGVPAVIGDGLVHCGLPRC